MEVCDMPFVKVDPIQEARELQEVFKDNPSAREEFKRYELAHVEAERLQQEEIRLRNELTEMRKRNNITQKDLEEASGLSQQAISRIEVGKDVSPSLKSLIRYADAIGCHLTLELNPEAKTV
jgi:DNA-binding XRE family transcriptional regulator